MILSVYFILASAIPMVDRYVRPELTKLAVVPQQLLLAASPRERHKASPGGHHGARRAQHHRPLRPPVWELRGGGVHRPDVFTHAAAALAHCVPGPARRPAGSTGARLPLQLRRPEAALSRQNRMYPAASTCRVS